MSQSVADSEALSSLEGSVVDAVSIDEPWALLEKFSGLERLSGTEEEEEAAEYIANRLESFGVSYERYDPELYISQPHDATIRTPDREFEPGPVKTVSFAASTTVSGDVVYVGSVSDDLLSEGSAEENDFEDVDLDGKIALTTAGSLSIRATSILEDRGAIGVVAIHQHDSEPHNGIATPIWGGAPRLDEKDEIPDVPIVNVSKPDGETLREWAESDDGLKLEMETDLTTDWFECPVIEARIEGGSSPENDDFVLLHGHYDSWYVGITDNATGDAGLLELARIFDEHSDQLDRDLRIAWWPAHSTGRYAGSTWYADEFAQELNERCVAQVNMDSPGAKDATEYTDMSCWTPEAHPLVADAIEDVTGAPYEEHFPFRAGDYSFDNLGITGFFMLSSNIPTDVREERGYHEVGGCGGNSDAWHVSTDTLDKAGKDELVRDIRLYAVSLLRVLNADVLPFDHARNVASIRETVAEYDEAAGEHFDFGPVLDELDSLETELESFYADVGSGATSPAEANDAIKRLSRILTRLNLVRDGQFEQDPAVGRQPVPRLAPAQKFDALEGDDAKFLQVQLKRESNAVIGELRRARELVA
ncbi:M28 family metallopeptidase (plasmid) [Halorussus salilacus]|uniref:M28 family peptidase n=1 Tax=Halorussus salilacus TaxID=2953750 RepID=UPI0020A1DC89|nr:M28 family peptidase [Halorussus salilacus]USZ70184.1 M28 family metallopeptidase [Halorussus salilacus]